MKFDDLKSIIDIENDLELNLISSDWAMIQGENSELDNWLTKEDFEQLFSPLPEFKSNETVFAFEKFERIYKSTGEIRRLSGSFHLNWKDFSDFQDTTDILCFYLVSPKLSWVLYANRDVWQFAKVTNKPLN
ncbi:hypothetical protein JK628_16860 [Shewanella sp. KX20019]|uniref:hypothetical protein n=1 Tax=Shewanella sp. KX20019 TaxID=2803864 RepID=UPI00192588D0|nr:hypothetical protein [Shewanella sp. KX20019]QQX79212.1 hypothetical protein JK628_16860 [Shewanella sp. KX20019]